MLQKETIPAQAGILGKLAHYPCLENSQILVPGNSMPFPSVGQGKKRILVNNFDAAVRRAISFRGRIIAIANVTVGR